MNPALSLVKTPQPEPAKRGIDVAALQHAEIKARDWGKVHIECDRSPPVILGRGSGRWSLPVSRKVKV